MPLIGNKLTRNFLKKIYIYIGMIEFILFIFIMSCVGCVITIGLIYILMVIFKVVKNVFFAVGIRKLKNINKIIKPFVGKYLEFNKRPSSRHSL